MSSVEASRLMLQDVASGLRPSLCWCRRGSAAELLRGMNSWWVGSIGVGGDDGNDGASGGGGGGGEETNGGKQKLKDVIGGVVGERLDAATSTLLGVVSGLRRHLHLPDAPLAADARAALQASLEDARGKVRQTAAALARGGSAALHGLEDAAAEAARETVHLLEQQVTALHNQLSETPEDIVMPDEPAPRWPMYVFLAGAIVCLLFSSTCHTLACVGARVSSIVWRIDYVGIAVLIVASFYPVVYYSFYCVPSPVTFISPSCPRLVSRCSSSRSWTGFKRRNIPPCAPCCSRAWARAAVSHPPPDVLHLGGCPHADGCDAVVGNSHGSVLSHGCVHIRSRRPREMERDDRRVDVVS